MRNGEFPVHSKGVRWGPRGPALDQAQQAFKQAAGAVQAGQDKAGQSREVLPKQGYTDRIKSQEIQGLWMQFGWLFLKKPDFFTQASPNFFSILLVALFKVNEMGDLTFFWKIHFAVQFVIKKSHCFPKTLLHLKRFVYTKSQGKKEVLSQEKKSSHCQNIYL